MIAAGVSGFLYLVVAGFSPFDVVSAKVVAEANISSRSLMKSVNSLMVVGENYRLPV
ncbi:MAG: hypothetical protein NWE94_09375 [Candidatus Bathyarchaeota archaeon]|nr:hypothetical protein [Candidatus Bathyarchaeota archaeon]